MSGYDDLVQHTPGHGAQGVTPEARHEGHEVAGACTGPDGGGSSCELPPDERDEHGSRQRDRGLDADLTEGGASLLGAPRPDHILGQASAKGSGVTLEVRDMGRPPGLNELKTMHYRSYAQVRYSWEMRLLGLGVAHIPTPCELEFTVLSANAMDWDNACSCCKVPLDALQRIGRLENDSPSHIVRFTARQERCSRKSAGIRLTFTPL